jgi:predicted DNA-binding transcriptional regulator AlpA
MTISCEVDGCTQNAAADSPAPRLALDGLRVCTVCRSRFEKDLIAVPRLFHACEQMLTVSTQTHVKVSGKGRPGIALNIAAVEARDALRARLRGWCDLVVTERACTAPARAVPSMAGFLLRHIDWLCAHSAAGDALSEIAEAAAMARRAADPARARRFSVGPCVESDCRGNLVALVHPKSQLLPGEVRCDEDPGHVWPAHRWRELDRLVSHQNTIGNRWLTVGEVAQLWNTSTSNVYRLASEHHWRRRTNGRRVYYYEADVDTTMN